MEPTDLFYELCKYRGVDHLSVCPKMDKISDASDTYQYNRIVDVVSGDSIVVFFDMEESGCDLYVRLNGIACCPMDSQNPSLKQKALEARNRLFELVTDIICDPVITPEQIKKYCTAGQLIHVVPTDIEYWDNTRRHYCTADVSMFHKKCETFQQILLREQLAYPLEDRLKTEQELLDYFFPAAMGQ